MKKIAVSLLALTLAVFLAVPATAEFKPYGSVRLLTGWWDLEANDAGPGKPLHDPDNPINDDEDLVWELSDISRFGAKFKTGDLGGRVEFGLKGDGRSNNGVSTRLLYGTWDFGGGTLLVGQEWTPYTFTSAQIAPRYNIDGNHPTINSENTFIGYGCLWNSRQPQIELKLDNGFYVALIQPETKSSVKTGLPGLAPGVDVDEDTTIPKICIGYEFKTEGLMLSPGFGYNTYEADIDALDCSEDIDSYLFYLNGKAALGMADLQWSVHYGQNLGDFGLWNREDAAYAHIDTDGNIEDSDCYGGYLQVAFNIGPPTITLGYGYVQSENDVAGDDEDEQQSYFIQAKIPIADTFYVVPEFSFYDQMEDANGNDEPQAWFAGLLWRMDF